MNKDALTMSVQPGTGSPSQSNKARKINKMHTERKGRCETVSVC